MRELRTSLGRLSQATDLEAGARALMDEALQIVEAYAPGVAREESLGSLRVLRALLHLRTDESYEALFVQAREGREPADPLPSASAWRLLQEGEGPVSCDLAVGKVQQGALFVHLDEVGQTALSRESTRRLRRREVTHFHATPLRLPGGRLIGMLVVEVDCDDAAGVPFGLWGAASRELADLGRLGALYLEHLPGRALPDVGAGPLPGSSPAMRAKLNVLERVSSTEARVLLTGETGVGKSWLARWLHERSPRARGPFVEADLHQLPEDLATARLFGAVKGAWTDGEAQEGCLAQAHGGTLFLDEVGELSPPMQARLLGFLDHGRYKRVGESTDTEADVRVIAATNVDLQEAVREGRFRRDLYHRLARWPVAVPPLRERREEIPAWSRHFLTRCAARLGVSPPPTLHPALEAELASRPWTGNLRELEDTLERLVTLEGGGVLGVQALRALDSLLAPPPQPGASEALRRAAEAFLAESRARVSRGEAPIPLMTSRGALTGMIVAVALAQEEEPRAAARLLGLEKRLRGGNHLETFRRNGEHLQELLAELGEPSPPELEGL
ncbi:MAG: sigma-54-dependent Fis family transcriptional regulator [Alphaproteobacteria bacterium]|nr:sigma-54-dependent Fis family transcriptional regulator [Alphaproteobacteria bacterium]